MSDLMFPTNSVQSSLLSRILKTGSINSFKQKADPMYFACKEKLCFVCDLICLQRIFFDFICLQKASHQILSLKFLAPTVMMLLIVETFSLTLTLTVDNHRSLDWLLIFTRASLRVSWEMRVVQIHSTWFIFNRHQPMIRYHGTVSLKKEKSFLTKHQHYR